LGLDGRCFFQSAAIAPDWWGARNDMRGIALKCGVGGIDPCVVPIREMLLANLFPCDFYVSGDLSPLISRLRRQLPPQGEAFLQESFRATQQGDKQSHLHTPYSSPAATNCLQSSPPKGKPFCKSLFVLHDKAISKSIYTRPHSSPAATNCLQSSPPKGKPFCKSLFALHDKAISESIYTRPHPLLRRQTTCSLLPLRGSLPYAVQP